MMEKTSLLLLRLEGALQSWGENAKWDTRDSASMPTKSGIVGLIACAMGLERDAPEIIALSDAISVSIRADRPGVKTVDFQTVTGEPLRKSDGSKRSGGNTFISQRTYLQDASFLVVIATDQNWHDRIVAALKAPKWSVFLGRKCCIPSRPVLEQESVGSNDVLTLLHSYPLAAKAVYPVSFETDIPLTNAPQNTRTDEIIPGNRTFTGRTVWHGVIKEGANVSD